MEYGAIDLHLRRSQIRILADDETVVLDRRVDTTRGDFDRVFAGRPRLRILLEQFPVVGLMWRLTSSRRCPDMVSRPPWRAESSTWEGPRC